ncbi:hypothetical protein RSK20926_06452 [Roseobacter sp. SK209-2-6]|uniref:hypothetical protein n=1 Tax=Roseobacter sp. SK209-2-6 TaxID=388739 RepID=UPI0000F3D7A2|nr:hypothetical protein [Roseobacter sp. SK209-2-6]EBA17355.1 hypothetical protein RSK20926_06452 [Roseobacter sp. SK209-2-6]
MAGKREKPEEFVSKLRQVEVLQGQGATIADEAAHYHTARMPQSMIALRDSPLHDDGANTQH